MSKKTRLAVCLDATPVLVNDTMYVTVGNVYEVIPCPESFTVQVLKPDWGGPMGDNLPIRYLEERFKYVD
jgi:hypothetical protein